MSNTPLCTADGKKLTINVYDNRDAIKPEDWNSFVMTFRLEIIHPSDYLLRTPEMEIMIKDSLSSKIYLNSDPSNLDIL